MYTFVPFLVMLAIYSLRRAVEGDGWGWWVVQVLATSVTFYSHILAALVIPVQVLLFFVWWRQARRQWVGGLISLALLTLPYLPLAFWQFPLVFQARETGFSQYTLGQMLAVLFTSWSVGVLGDASVMWPSGMIVWGALALFGLVSPLVPWLEESKRLDWRLIRKRIALLCWLVLPIFAIWLVSRWQPIFTDRYLIWTAAAFYLFAATGLAFFFTGRDWGRWVAGILVCVVVLLQGLGLRQQATYIYKSDFRSAVAYLDQRYEPGQLIIFQIPYAQHSFDYYTSLDAYTSAEGLFTNYHYADGTYLMSEEEASTQMTAITGGYDQVWLLATESEMWDERGLVHQWLEDHFYRVGEAHFMRVDIYLYQR